MFSMYWAETEMTQQRLVQTWTPVGEDSPQKNQESNGDITAVFAVVQKAQAHAMRFQTRGKNWFTPLREHIPEGLMIKVRTRALSIVSAANTATRQDDHSPWGQMEKSSAFLRCTEYLGASGHVSYEF